MSILFFLCLFFAIAQVHTWVFHVLEMCFALSTHGVHLVKKVSIGDVFLSGDVSILIFALLEECM